MSPAELQIESLLLKERWSLIQAGHQRKSIRINSRTSSIYLNNQVFGKVINSKFVRSLNHTSTVNEADQEPLITLASPAAATSTASKAN